MPPPDTPDNVDDMVCVRPSDIIEEDGGTDEEVMVCDRPGGGAAPKMLEKAASRWKLLGAEGPYWFCRGGGILSCWYSAISCLWYAKQRRDGSLAKPVHQKNRVSTDSRFPRFPRPA